MEDEAMKERQVKRRTQGGCRKSASGRGGVGGWVG